MFYEKRIRLCFVGNPNVGKSTLINRILKNNKLKTNKEPGTTTKIIETNFFGIKKNLFLLILQEYIERKVQIHNFYLKQLKFVILFYSFWMQLLKN